MSVRTFVRVLHCGVSVYLFDFFFFSVYFLSVSQAGPSLILLTSLSSRLPSLVISNPPSSPFSDFSISVIVFCLVAKLPLGVILYLLLLC